MARKKRKTTRRKRGLGATPEAPADFTFQFSASKGTYRKGRGRKINQRGKLANSADLKPCETGEKGTCKTQLVFKKGKAFVRFCEDKGKPAFEKQVADAREANRVVQDVCACVAETGSSARCKDRAR